MRPTQLGRSQRHLGLRDPRRTGRDQERQPRQQRDGVHTRDPPSRGLDGLPRIRPHHRGALQLHLPQVRRGRTAVSPRRVVPPLLRPRHAPGQTIPAQLRGRRLCLRRVAQRPTRRLAPRRTHALPLRCDALRGQGKRTGRQGHRFQPHRPTARQAGMEGRQLRLLVHAHHRHLAERVARRDRRRASDRLHDDPARQPSAPRRGCLAQCQRRRGARLQRDLRRQAGHARHRLLHQRARPVLRRDPQLRPVPRTASMDALDAGPLRHRLHRALRRRDHRRGVQLLRSA